MWNNGSPLYLQTKREIRYNVYVSAYSGQNVQHALTRRKDYLKQLKLNGLHLTLDESDTPELCMALNEYLSDHFLIRLQGIYTFHHGLSV